MLKINNYQNYIFDCDGVILKSNEVKTNAFKFALNNYENDKVDKLIKYHQINGGISRYKKIEYFFKHIEKNTEKPDLQKYINKFGLYSSKNLKKSELMNGVLDFVKYIYQKDRKLFIVSGSEEKELKKIINYKKLSKYFSGIFGSPKDKYQLLKDLSSNIELDNSVFFGDSEIDYNVSKLNNIDFIYVSEDSEWETANQYNFHNSIKNFSFLKYD